jgi:hypothetical protein
VSYPTLARNSTKNNKRWPQIESNFAGEPPYYRAQYFLPVRIDISELEITQECLELVGGGKPYMG